MGIDASDGMRPSNHTWQWLGWRVVALSLVFVAGLTGFALGAELSERPGLPDADVQTHLYYTLGLFVLGGLDLGVPNGGPLSAQLLLWFAYFAAPTLTATTLIEGVVRAMGPERWRLKRIKRHIVIGGCGQLTLLYLDRLRACDSRIPVIVVELQPDNPNLSVARERYGATIVHGDIAANGVLELVGVTRARRVMLLSGSDFANMDAALRIQRDMPELAKHTVTHVADLRTLRLLERTKLVQKLTMFNSHQIAATHLVTHHVLDHFQRTDPRDLVVIAGFGRFGQTVLDVLQHGSEGAFDKVVVIDLEAELRVQTFQEQVGFSATLTHEHYSGDLRDPRIWQALDPQLREISPVIILASASDRANIETATRLARRLPDATVLARADRATLLGSQLADECGFSLVDERTLVRDALDEQWIQPNKALPGPVVAAISRTAQRLRTPSQR